MYSLKEAALAHAKAADRILEPHAEFLNQNEEVIPVFINLLFQSIEITLKSLAIESGIATESDLRHRQTARNGHGIKEIGCLINQKNSVGDVVDILLPKSSYKVENEIINAVIFGIKFSPSRESYIKRTITYSQFGEGDLQVLHGVKSWVRAVRLAAENVESAATLIKAG